MHPGVRESAYEPPIRSAHVSFRNRLALFFVLIVIVPMLAVAFLLFRLIDESERGKIDAAIAQQHSTALRLFGEQRDLAAAALEEVAGGERTTRDQRLSQRAAGGRARPRARAGGGGADHQRPERAAGRRAGGSGGSCSPSATRSCCSAGSRAAIAPSVRPLQSTSRRELGELALSITDAPTYAERAARADRRGPAAGAARRRGQRRPGARQHADARARPRRARRSRRQDADGRGDEYRVQRLRRPQPVRQPEDPRLHARLADGDAGSASENRTFAAVILLGFLLLAIACAMLVSRTLQREIAGFLTAARKLAAGDFSAQVPTSGRDEFAALGEEFNKMSGELERRLAELSQERGRVQSSMRRLGEAVAVEPRPRRAAGARRAHRGRRRRRRRGSRVRARERHRLARRALARGQPARPGDARCSPSRPMP